MVNISCCKVFFFVQNVPKKRTTRRVFFRGTKRGEPDRLIGRACARAPQVTRRQCSIEAKKSDAPVSIYTADYVERTVNGRKRRRHNRSRYGIINAVPLNFCAPLSSNSLRPTSSLRTRRRKKNKIGTRWIAKKRKGRGSMAVGGGSCVSEAALSQWVNKFRF